MGRRRASAEPIDPELIRQTFSVRQDGALVRRSCRIGAFEGEVATFRGPKGQWMVRLNHYGRTRRLIAGKVAWSIATGAWPRGIVRHRDGDETNFRAENLIVVKRGQNPFSVGTSSLDRRAAVDTKLVKVLAENPDATIPMLSRLTGSSKSCCCHRLGKLSERGLACGPKCDARRRWELTQSGRDLAAGDLPALDERDRSILGAIVSMPMKVVEIAREIGVCHPTVGRRLGALVVRKLASNGDGRYRVTDEGRRILGLGASPPRWLRPEMVSAANSRNVLRRIECDGRGRSTLHSQDIEARAKRTGKYGSSFNVFQRAAG